MTVRAFDIPDGTLKALEELAGITDVHSKDPVSEVIVDALRTYEWIIAQQANGMVVTALAPQEMDFLSRNEGVPDADRETLVPFVPPRAPRPSPHVLQIGLCQTAQASDDPPT